MRRRNLSLRGGWRRSSRGILGDRNASSLAFRSGARSLSRMPHNSFAMSTSSESSSSARRLQRSRESLTVAELLISAGQHRHSVIAHWLAVRELFFSFLEARRTPFVSTEDALRHLISDHLDGNASAMLAEAYHLGRASCRE